MSFLSNLFKKKTAKPTVGIDEQMANEQDAQAAHAKQIEEKIKHYQAHGKPKSNPANQIDDPNFGAGANQLAKEDYGSVIAAHSQGKKGKKN